MNNKLENYGLTEKLTTELDNNYPDLFIGRIITEHKNLYKMMTSEGEILGEIKGKLNYEANGTGDYPAVGDWVAIDRTSNATGNSIIHDILPRKSKLSRKVAGNTFDEQVIATNIDTLFICMALNNDFNLRRLERYIAIAWDSGATPVIILTKMDLCEDLDQKLLQIDEIASFIEVHPISSITNEGIELLDSYINPANTIAFIGSSGVGKSTLINTLLGNEHLKTGGIRGGDDKGKHTTTHRELIPLKNGCSLIDTPGMRELSLLDDVDGVSKSFEDIEALITQCKFTNCSHSTEPGCKIKEVLDNGSLEQKRYDSYLKLLREAEFAKRKQSAKENRKHGKDFNKMVRNMKKITF